MVRVFFDTNILLEPGKSKLDVWAELARVLPEPYEAVVLPKSVPSLNPWRASRAAGAGPRSWPWAFSDNKV